MSWTLTHRFLNAAGRPAGLLDPARNAPRKVPLTEALGGETRWGGR